MSNNDMTSDDSVVKWQNIWRLTIHLINSLYYFRLHSPRTKRPSDQPIARLWFIIRTMRRWSAKQKQSPWERAAPKNIDWLGQRGRRRRWPRSTITQCSHVGWSSACSECTNYWILLLSDSKTSCFKTLSQNFLQTSPLVQISVSVHILHWPHFSNTIR